MTLTFIQSHGEDGGGNFFASYLAVFVISHDEIWYIVGFIVPVNFVLILCGQITVQER